VEWGKVVSKGGGSVEGVDGTLVSIIGKKKQKLVVFIVRDKASAEGNT